MHTDLLYYHDSYLAEFTATVLSTGRAGEHTEVVLDRTAFYPEGGGQPADLGLLAGLPVASVVERDEEVVHLVKGEVPAGGVRCLVDWERRFDHMQQHTGQHLLSQAFERLAAAPTVSFRMGEGGCGIDVATPGLDPGQVEAVERLTNRIVFENRSVLAHLVSPEDLSRFQLRKGTERTAQIRVVEVQGFDACPCGGTHCRSTGEVGLVKVVRWDRRGGNTRVEFSCGGRALRDYGAKNETVVALAAALSVSDRQVREAVERLLRQAEGSRRQRAELRERLLDYQAAELDRGAVALRSASVVAATLEGLSAEELRHLASRLTSRPGRVAVLVGASEKPGVVFARSADLSLDAGALFRRVCGPLGGRGGGRPNLAQGGLPEASLAGAVVEAALRELRSLLD